MRSTNQRTYINIFLFYYHIQHWTSSPILYILRVRSNFTRLTNVGDKNHNTGCPVLLLLYGLIVCSPPISNALFLSALSRVNKLLKTIYNFFSLPAVEARMLTDANEITSVRNGNNRFRNYNQRSSHTVLPIVLLKI